MTVRRLDVSVDTTALARRVADHVVELLLEVQRHHDPSIVLTGGSVSRVVHRAIATHSRTTEVSWDRIHVWWGDERFVEASDPERNVGQATEDLLSLMPVSPERIHAMSAASSDGPSAGAVAAGAAAYDDQLQAFAATRTGTWFDLLMLGIGPDSHCASLFPGRPVPIDVDVIAVTESPKPPPNRISLTHRALGRADRVWFVAGGADKASAVAASRAGEDVLNFPSAGPRGAVETVWWLDQAAAART